MSEQQTYKQVRDVVVRIRDAHQRLRDALEESRSRASDSRSRHMLESLRQEEQELQSSLAKQLKNGDSQKVLDTWLQYTPDAELFETLEQIDFRPEMSAEEVVACKQKFDEDLTALLRQLKEATATPSVEEFFGSLLEEIETRIGQASWKLREFQGDEDPPEPAH
ncbi:MAG: hypothetical protein DWQ34_14380 [Planctomycetota bacterium]|nr:MAG: hypothetical protein DWQ34_14380 [Planctomycetota bacterium]REJ94960.1 MAG: hypothetical protein DWQ29_02390 [Planctomycetota bacterium]REK20004.1 MAG: hypothetical protein DWQ41_27175 [Planctomycetota bacterium]REK27571.1 MAG: hypothetical protein DWQ45_26195 [Planctomycetota bacterium]